MSRIGKLPINLPEKVVIKCDNGKVTVKGPSGEIEYDFGMKHLALEIKDNVVSIKNDTKSDNTAMWGTIRSKVAAMVQGISKPFEKNLNLNGVGIKCSIKGKYITLHLGKSHPFKIEVPSDISVSIPSTSKITLSSIDKKRVSKFADLLFNLMPVEPYKGKGIRYDDKPFIKKEIRKG